MAKRKTLGLQPLEDRLIVELMDPETVTPGGIVLPDTAQQKSERAKVVAIGPGRRGDDGERIPLAVGVGDEVICAKYGGISTVKVDGDEYTILQESDVLAKVTNK